MLGRISGQRVLVSFIESIRFKKPSAETCVGIVMMSRMTVKASLRSLKSYA